MHAGILTLIRVHGEPNRRRYSMDGRAAVAGSAALVHVGAKQKGRV